MKHPLAVHWQFIKMKYASRMAYRADLIVSVLAFMLFQFIGIAIIGVIHFAGGSFPGWTFANLVLLQGSLNLIRGISHMLFMGVLWNSNYLVRSGTLDLILLRPIQPLYLLIMDSFDEEDVGQFVGGLVLFCIGLSMNAVIWWKVLLFIPFLLIGMMFFFSIALLSSAVTIRFINTNRLYEFTDLISIIAGYPRVIYGKIAGVVFTTIVPLVVAASLPAEHLLGITGGGFWIGIISAILLVFFAIGFWHSTLKKYTSAGG